jgi:hypothetical protein
VKEKSQTRQKESIVGVGHTGPPLVGHTRPGVPRVGFPKFHLFFSLNYQIEVLQINGVPGSSTPFVF